MTWTAFICTATICGLLVWDILTIAKSGVPTSVSEWMKTTALKSPLFSFCFGFLCGHWFGYMV